MAAKGAEDGMPYIFVVDDDDMFRESLTNNLLDENFRVDDFDNGQAVLDHLSDQPPPDLILLDWKMPQVNGIDVLRKLRQNGIETPVIFLTHLTDQIYEEAALSTGAVDFVEKSRSFSILLRRIENSIEPVMADAGAATPDTENFALDRQAKTVALSGRRVALTPMEFDVLLHLVDHEGDPVRSRDLFAIVYGDDEAAKLSDAGFRRNIRDCINRIRNKFREADSDFAAIEDIPGQGYRWTAPMNPES